MAGIVAICGCNAEKEADLARTMMSRVKHRGPDRERTFSRPGVVLGYVAKRTDPHASAVEIPYVDRQQQVAITCDAEIYNPEEFLPEDRLGEPIESKSATSIISAFVESRESREAKLDGPFSFVLWSNGQIYAGRDRLGIAPLYTGDREELTIFASELKALTGLAQNIREFPPGYVYLAPGSLQEYAPVTFSDADMQHIDHLCEQLRKLLGEAVKKRVSCCRSKKGVFLSGGIDSSVIA
ncbi:MAG: hypothetical protein JSV16_14595, partial [Candidatus Hydrogenedentota bacterium]